MKSKMKFYTTYNKAWAAMNAHNVAQCGCRNLWVLVNGPDNHYAVMPLSEAIENDFCYEWACV